MNEDLVLDIGAVANLGYCVARHDDGRVVFVRHALPGERVRARVTEDRGSFLRADAVEVLTASPDRVTPPCRYAGPGKCGGCDWQHATPSAQRRLKAAVIRELFERIAGIAVDVEVEEVPGGPLGWRTRAQFAVDDAGRIGLRRHRRHAVQPLDDCLLVAEPIRSVLGTEHRPGSTVEIAASNTGELAATERRGRRRTPEKVVHETALGRRFQVHGFWQVHPAAAETLVACVREFLAPRTGERALDLYAGAGLFTAALAESVGPDGSVVAVESDPVAVADGQANLADLPQAEMRAGDAVTFAAQLPPADIVVLDPPRAGAGRVVMQALIAAGPRAIAYVSCDPATLAADVRVAMDNGYEPRKLRAFDLFPMTHHMECVALLVSRTGSAK